ncbi:MAG: Crp/Fnr family transcriptional regulator [Phyllobacterium sp.]
MTCVSPTFLHFFQSPPIRAALADVDVEALQGLKITQRHYPPHSVVFHQGDIEHRMLIVNSGWSCVYRDLPTGDRQIIDFPLKGDILGLRTAQGQIYNSFASITDLSVFEITLSELNPVVSRSPLLSQIFMGLLARQRSILVEHLTNLGRRSASVRIAHLFLELAVRLENGGLTTAAGFSCPLTQYELADALGLTAIHINRMLRELRERGLVAFKNGEVEFLNRTGLTRLANFDPGYLSLKAPSAI